MEKPPVIQLPLEIETISPLHIGSGEKWNRRLDIIQEGAKVYIINHEKIHKKAETNVLLQNELISLYESEEGHIRDVLNRHHLSVNNFAQRSGTQSYCIPSFRLSTREILCFIKAVDNLVFIPGSSIKGGIRSALLRSHLLDHEKRQNYQSRVKSLLNKMKIEIKSKPQDRDKIQKDYKRKISDFIETSFFGSDQHRDLLRCIQFADSKPKDVSSVCIKEVKVLSVSNNGLQIKRTRQGRDMIINAEAVEAKKTFESTVTINQYLLLKEPAVEELNFSIKKNLILRFFKYCQNASFQLIKQEIEFFETFKQNRLREWYEKNLLNHKLKDNQCLLHLGWGSGFDTKTISNLFEEEVLNGLRWAFNLGKFIKDQTGKRKMINPFPKSRKIIFENNQPNEPLGWVKLTVEV